MTRYIKTSVVVLALAASVCIGAANAGPRACAQGSENVAGTCVTAGLAPSTQLRGTLLSQTKLGHNPPIPPRIDTLYPRNFDVSRFEFSQFGNFSVETRPPSP